jgi:CRISP-associated protein Cas1
MSRWLFWCITMETIEPSSLGIVTLSGFNISLSVDNDHLIVNDGSGTRRRKARYHRAYTSFNRIVIHGHTGYISLAAFKWLYDKHISVTVVDYDATLLFTTTPFQWSNPQLKRQQVAIAFGDEGIELAKHCISHKIAGQIRIIRDACGAVDTDMQRCLDAVANATSIADIVQYEGFAATVYWGYVSRIPVRFASHNKSRIPKHWSTIGQRISPLSKTGYKASNPAHAMLNYLYTLAHSEAVIALESVGLDASLGIIHAERENRAAFALDCIEVIRPDIDDYLIELTQVQRFRYGDFVQTAEGQCRLMPTMVRQLCETLPLWRGRLQTVVADALKIVAHSNASIPQTGATTATATTCRYCGKPVSRKRRYCSGVCKEAYKTTVLQPAFERSGVQALAKMRAAGFNPATSSVANKLRSEKRSERLAQEQQYEAEHGLPPNYREQWKTQHLPRIQRVAIRQLARASGLSLRMCSLVRRGASVPHPMYWDRLISAASTED